MPYTPLVKAVTDDDVAKVQELLASGASLEEVCECEFYDCVHSSTALGWAVRSWSSPELISVLVNAGANVKSSITTEGKRESPLAYLNLMQKQFADPDGGDVLYHYQLEFWGRAPTAAWFADVTRILSQANTHLGGASEDGDLRRAMPRCSSQ